MAEQLSKIDIALTARRICTVNAANGRERTSAATSRKGTREKINTGKSSLAECFPGLVVAVVVAVVHVLYPYLYRSSSVSIFLANPRLSRGRRVFSPTFPRFLSLSSPALRPHRDPYAFTDGRGGNRPLPRRDDFSCLPRAFFKGAAHAGLLTALIWSGLYANENEGERLLFASCRALLKSFILRKLKKKLINISITFPTVLRYYCRIILPMEFRVIKPASFKLRKKQIISGAHYVT